ncbi:MAG: hypothetical protein ACRERC_04325 [Candidatus Binatia bacterium]
MRYSSLALALAVAGAFVAGATLAVQPGPVIQQLGPVVPTPQPSPKAEDHIRLITSFTVGNKPDGESVISFEATDFGISGTKKDETKFRTIATEQYTLVEPKPAARAQRDEIVRKLRELEQDLLRYVEITGPPRARDPISSQGTTRP